MNYKKSISINGIVFISICIIVFCIFFYLNRQLKFEFYNDKGRSGLYRTPLTEPLELLSTDGYSWDLAGYGSYKVKEKVIDISKINQPINGIYFDTIEYKIFYEDVYISNGSCDIVLTINIRDSTIVVDCVSSSFDFSESTSPIKLHEMFVDDRDLYLQKYVLCKLE